MTGVSLFAGGGIPELCFENILPDYRTIAYVEIDEYCRAIIRARIRDGVLRDAPIFDDIREFNSRYASLYAGKVDWVSAGFPCQPFSNAGKRQGEADDRNLWPETVECIGILRPRYAFLENVPAIVTNEYFRRIQGDLAEIFYDCVGLPLSAAEVGANHKREREWILAYPSKLRCNTRRPEQSLQGVRSYGETFLAHADSNRCDQGRKSISETGSNGIVRNDSQLPDATSIGSQGQRGTVNPSDPEANRKGQRNNLVYENGRSVEPGLGRVAHGVAYRVDRLKAIGNGWDGGMVKRILRVTQGSSND